MQKEGGRQVYENYIRKENWVTLESRIAPWISAHGRKPGADKKLNGGGIVKMDL